MAQKKRIRVILTDGKTKKVYSDEMVIRNKFTFIDPIKVQALEISYLVKENVIVIFIHSID